MKVNLFIKVLLILLTLYGVFVIVIYYFQDRLIFQNKSLPAEHSFTFDIPFDEYMIPAVNDEKINLLHFKTDRDSVRGIVLYFHGNADNLKRWGKYSIDFTSLGYDVIMFDYQGYGKSSGKPNETVMYQDAEKIWKWANNNFDYPRWVLYGRSIGSAVASHLATKTTPDFLFLETPFDELNNAGGAKFLPFDLKYSFPNKKHLSKVSCKKAIVYGGKDITVPESSTLKLKGLMKKGELFIRIPEGGHKNLRKFELYHSSLREIFQSQI